MQKISSNQNVMVIDRTRTLNH